MRSSARLLRVCPWRRPVVHFAAVHLLRLHVPSGALHCYNCAMKKKALAWSLSIAAMLLILFLFTFYWPTGKREMPPEGYTAFQDDVLALRYCPVFESSPSYGPIMAIYYRAARDGAGNLHIAYHPVWKEESNRSAGWGPFLSRTIYTGGLSLQRIMFGKGDVESIGVTIDAEGDISGLEYETTKDYDPRSFSVTHLPVKVAAPIGLPLHFRIASWNHLFVRLGNESAETDIPSIEGTEVGRDQDDREIFAAEGADVLDARSVPFGYFSAELWSDYAMWKNPETILRKNRSHFVWERGVVR